MNELNKELKFIKDKTYLKKSKITDLCNLVREGSFSLGEVFTEIKNNKDIFNLFEKDILKVIKSKTNISKNRQLGTIIPAILNKVICYHTKYRISPKSFYAFLEFMPQYNSFLNKYGRQFKQEFFWWRLNNYKVRASIPSLDRIRLSFNCIDGWDNYKFEREWVMENIEIFPSTLQKYIIRKKGEMKGFPNISKITNTFEYKTYLSFFKDNPEKVQLKLILKKIHVGTLSESDILQTMFNIFSLFEDIDNSRKEHNFYYTMYNEIASMLKYIDKNTLIIIFDRFKKNKHFKKFKEDFSVYFCYYCPKYIEIDEFSWFLMLVIFERNEARKRILYSLFPLKNKKNLTVDIDKFPIELQDSILNEFKNQCIVKYNLHTLEVISKC